MGYSASIKMGFDITFPQTIVASGYVSGCPKHGQKTGKFCDQCGAKNTLISSDGDDEEFLKDLLDEMEIEDYSAIVPDNTNELIHLVIHGDYDYDFADSNNGYFYIPNMELERNRFILNHQSLLDAIEKRFGKCELQFVCGLHESY